MARILIADGDVPSCDRLARSLTGAGLGPVETVHDGEEAMKCLSAICFEVAFLDMRLPGSDGLTVLRRVRQRGLQTQVVMLAERPSIEEVVLALQIGAQDCLQKPAYLPGVIDCVRRLLDRRRFSPHVLADRLNVFVRDRAAEPSLRLTDLCRNFRISRGYASRLFQRYIGASFTQRLSHYRVQKARELLAFTDVPVYQVAAQCGFRSPRRLAETFQRVEGMSPSAYRRHGRR